MRPQKAAAEEVLQAAAGAGKPELWRHTGYKNSSARRQIAPRNQGNKKAPDSRGLKGDFVELMGIEPTASRVRWRGDGPPSKDFEELQRQETSGSVPKRPILAACSQNSEPADPVAEQHASRQL